MNYIEKQNAIIEDFSLFDDWMEKYELIIDLGKEIEMIPNQDKRDEQLIEGCQSRVWLKSNYKDGKMFYFADSDAIITKGIISLLIKVMNGEEPKTIAKEDLFFIKEIGLQEHLSPTRANGLVEMVKRMKLDAIKNY
ncbi:MAG: SufE family protein [Crocinitomicaceae bacterium]|jgi:cysteine desulfuration protein SufE|nr:SufE family protein [Crocinitomicaceae bacterium]MDO7612651.1 SufE family protein [Crocinitomicaceae bacterium]